MKTGGSAINRRGRVRPMRRRQRILGAPKHQDEIVGGHLVHLDQLEADASGKLFQIGDVAHAPFGIGLAQVYSREEMRLKVWGAGGSEPGDGTLPESGVPAPRKGAELTASCPAAAAAVVASVVNGFTDRDVFVHLAGGDVFVQWDEKNNRLSLTGPTAYVFRGTFYFEEDG